MKSRTVATVVLVVILSLPIALHAQTEPQAVVKSMAASLTAGDLDGLMAYWSDDAVMEVVHLDAIYTGTDELRAVFEMLIGQHYEMIIAEVLEVEDDEITTSTKLASDETRALGVAIVTTQVYTVQDGKIKSLRCNWSEESLAALAAATATLPVTGGDVSMTHSVAAALAGLAALGGLGWGLRRHRLHQAQ